jgi:hypothetical protein
MRESILQKSKTHLLNKEISSSLQHNQTVAGSNSSLIFPVLVLGYKFFIVEIMTYQFLNRLKNLYDFILNSYY